jgi:FtsP/CotA-like multicopper oxidase with cupredoxin domain
MGAFVKRQRGIILAAAILAVIAYLVLGARVTDPALATSDGDPYTVPLVVDTNPDPNIVETTIVAQGALVDVGKKDAVGNTVMASVLTFNGTIPGPEFRLKVGDTVIVHFENQLAHHTGIHWHGIELNNASDGTPLTQDQVAPSGGKFLYKFKVSRPGIYWYHPHHHSSTNQVFKGLYGSIIVTDPNEAALIASGVLPGAAQTRTLALSDITVCNAVGSNDAEMYVDNPGDFDPPFVTGGDYPGQQGQKPLSLCETAPIDEDGAPRGPFGLGDVPNIQRASVVASPTNEGQTVLTNGKNVGGRAGTPLLALPVPLAPGPGALAPDASTLPVSPGQGVRLQIGNTATIRFFRLILSDNAGTQIPLVRIGGQGGLLDNAHVEGNLNTPPLTGEFDWKYTLGEVLLDPGDRADVVFAVPASATGVLTLWTQDFSRTGGGFSGLPTVPVAHFEVTGSPVAQYSIGQGTPLRAAAGGTNDPVETLGSATVGLLDPASFMPIKDGKSSEDIQLTNVGSVTLGIDGETGHHDPAPDFMTADHEKSARYAASLGDTLDLTVTNVTSAHHPFHLHGFSIQPISLTKPSDPMAPTYTWPYREFRDNVDVPKQYTLRFRVRLDDRPLMDGVTMGGGLGRWVFHCHIFFHATFGMISEFVVTDPVGNERPYISADGVLVTAAHPGDALGMTGRFHDRDGDAITLSATQGTIADSGDGVHWDWTHSATTSGFVYVTATTADGKKDQVAFQVQIGSPPVLTVPGPQTADYHDPLTFGISAIDPDGDAITLSASGLPAGLSLVDNGNGTGTVSGTLQATPGVYVATFSASDSINPPVSATVEITVTKEETSLAYTGPTVILNGANATLTAKLTEDDPTPVAGVTLNFTLGAQGCSGVTNASGVASCTILVSSALGTSIPITVNFAGDTFYEPSSANAVAIVFAFPSRGAFVLGDVSAGGGGTVTWWSSAWANVNVLSGGAAPSAFKGFAGTVTLPTSTPPAACGGPWSTLGGNSPPPTDEVPSFMGVLAASTAVKSGNTISGNTVRIVVVQVNPGFDSNSGSAGTGTVVAIYCN